MDNLLQALQKRIYEKPPSKPNSPQTPPSPTATTPLLEALRLLTDKQQSTTSTLPQAQHYQNIPPQRKISPLTDSIFTTPHSHKKPRKHSTQSLHNFNPSSFSNALQMLASSKPKLRIKSNESALKLKKKQKTFPAKFKNLQKFNNVAKNKPPTPSLKVKVKPIDKSACQESNCRNLVKFLDIIANSTTKQPNGITQSPKVPSLSNSISSIATIATSTTSNGNLSKTPNVHTSTHSIKREAII